MVLIRDLHTIKDYPLKAYLLYSYCDVLFAFILSHVFFIDNELGPALHALTT